MCDIINFREYEDVSHKILEKKPTRAITIFIDMKDIEKSTRICMLVIFYIYAIDFDIQKDGPADTEDGSDDDDEADVSANACLLFNLTHHSVGWNWWIFKA